MSAAVALWLRREARRRWSSLALLGLIAAATVAVALTAALGAIRSPDSFTRLRHATHASDWQVGLPEDADPAATLHGLASTGGVTAAALQTEVFVSPSIPDYYPDYNFLALAPGEGAAMDQPVIVAGRRADPARADEVMVGEHLARALGKQPGDHLVLQSVTDAWIQEAFNGATPATTDGPTIDLSIVGVARSPEDRGRYIGVVHLTPAFVDTYRGQMRMITFGAVRAESPPKLPEGYEVSPSFAADDGKAKDALNAIAIGMWLVAGLVAVTGVAVGAQISLAIARAAAHERAALDALGWSRRTIAASLAMLLGPAWLVGVVVGAAASVALSPRALIGLARAVDPHPHRIVIDIGLLMVGVASFVVAAVATVVAVAYAVTRHQLGRPVRAVRYPALSRPLAPVLGLRTVLSHDGAARANRSSIAVAAIGAVGVVAALAIGASIDHLRDDPTLSGQGGGRSIDSGESTDVLDAALPVLENDDRVAMLAVLHIFFPKLEDGSEVTAIAVDLRRGELDGTVLKGRLPQAPDEVDVGPATLHDLGLRLGDRLTLTGTESRSAQYRVVGTSLFPEGDFHFDAGIGMTAAAAARIVGDAHDGTAIHSIEFDWAKGVDGSAADAALGFEVYGNTNALVPAPVTNLGEVSGLTRFLAAMFGVLAVAGVAHGLVTGARRQRHGTGVLRAIGLPRRSVAAMLAATGGAVLVIGFAIGVPIGLIVARVLWNDIATRAHLLPRLIAPVTAMVVAGGAAIVLVAVLTLRSIVHATRTPAVEALRTE